MTRLIVISLIAAAVAAFIADRKGRDWVSWTLMTLLFPFSLLILFSLPSITKPGVTRNCPHCGATMGQGQAKCPACSADSPIEMVECPGCGKFVTLGTKCSECDSPL